MFDQSLLIKVSTRIQEFEKVRTPTRIVKFIIKIIPVIPKIVSYSFRVITYEVPLPPVTFSLNTPFLFPLSFFYTENT